jgi:hypothetical protein
MLVINPWRRKRLAALEQAQDEFEERCAAVIVDRMEDLGFERVLPGYSLEAGEFWLLYEGDGEEFARVYPGAVGSGDFAVNGCVDLWVHFHESTGQWEAELGADFYLDDQRVHVATDWRTDPAETLHAIADALGIELERLRDPAAKRPPDSDGRRDWSALIRKDLA